MKSYLIKNALLIDEKSFYPSDVLIKGERIEKIAEHITAANAELIDAEHMYLIPGAIDDQVHFREPGLTHKGNIYSESRAAVAGGITTFFEMPNTNPPALTQELLEEKYAIAAKHAAANYSFFMGSSNDNYEEVMRTDPSKICGIKIFMGSSTGNMLVDNPETLERVFANAPTIIATHCEDEATVKANMAAFSEKYGQQLVAKHHPLIRSEEACYLSSSMAVALAKKHQTRLHILHISTAKETALFENIPLEQKRITAEACIHHLWFSDSDYADKGNFIKWNPAIKTAADREGIWKALVEGRIDVVATDHAPHTLLEKQKPYSEAPSGGPLVQHSVQAMFDFYEAGKISLTMLVNKLSHNPAKLFKIKDRGFIREGYFADLVLVSRKPQLIEKSNLLYHCGWSPFEGHTFKHSIDKTFVNGRLVWSDGRIIETGSGKRAEFYPHT